MSERKSDQLVEVETGRLKPHPNNPRKGDVNGIMQSLERFGQIKPLIVQRSTGYVVAGNHTLKAIERLKWPKAKILVKDLTDEEAQAYLLADNRTSDLGGYDEGALAKLLQEAENNLEGTGYTSDDVDLLVASMNTGGAADDIGGDFEPEYVENQNHRETLTKAAAERQGEPLRDVVMMMRQSEAAEFGAQITVLQKAWGTRNVVETVRRAVAEAAEERAKLYAP